MTTDFDKILKIIETSSTGSNFNKTAPHSSDRYLCKWQVNAACSNVWHMYFEQTMSIYKQNTLQDFQTPAMILINNSSRNLLSPNCLTREAIKRRN